MKWHKLGKVYTPSYDGSWKHFSALAPTPIVLSDKIRVYAGFRDPSGVSRIGFVDVHKSNPTKIINISDKPVLDIGRKGAFDDNGINLGDIIIERGKLLMLYVGYQIIKE